MKHSQRKRYTLIGYNFTKISARKGNITYQLRDDKGNERTVNAMANVNIFNKVSSVKPIYQRELPLVQALSKTVLNDFVFVDFTAFNKNNPRAPKGDNRRAVPSVQRHNSAYSSTMSYESLAVSKFRFMQLLFISVVGFVALIFVLSKI